MQTLHKKQKQRKCCHVVRAVLETVHIEQSKLSIQSKVNYTQALPCFNILLSFAIIVVLCIVCV